jgi:hypothetical protein
MQGWERQPVPENRFNHCMNRLPGRHATARNGEGRSGARPQDGALATRPRAPFGVSLLQHSMGTFCSPFASRVERFKLMVS